MYVCIYGSSRDKEKEGTTSCHNRLLHNSNRVKLNLDFN